MEYSKKITICDQQKHLRDKTMWLGTKEVITSKEWVFKDDKMMQENVKYSPARLNSICELIANAIDHYVDTIDCNIRVNNIWIKHISNNDIWIIKNDGFGFNVEKTEDTNNMWSVEVAISHLMAGSNLNGNKSNCGTNGVGLKVIIANADRFEINTFDINRGIQYNQEVIKGKLEHPSIEYFDIPLDERIKMGGTTLYLKIGSDIKGTNDDILPLIKARIVQSKFYLDTTYGSKSPNIIYNGVNIEYSSSYFSLCPFKGTNINMFKFVSGKFKIGLSLTKNNSTTSVIIINGIPVKKCPIIKAIKNKMRIILKDEIDKLCLSFDIKTDYTCLYKKMFIAILANIENPQYVGQTKESISISDDIVKEFDIPKEIIESYWKGAKDSIESLFLLKKMKKVARNKKIPSDKYVRPYRYGQHATLFIPEGNSAQSLIRNGIDISDELEFSKCGIFSIQGIPTNVRKKIKKGWVDGSDEPIIQKHDLLNNEKFQELLTVLGYDYTIDYKNDENATKLNYGRIVIAADRDHDGAQIAGLILNMICIFMPCLIKTGKVFIFETPLIRAYKNNKSISFISESNFEEWKESKENINSYDIVYYKGLAGHDEYEELDMFANFGTKLKKVTYNDINMFETFYGADTNKRKLILSSPLVVPLDYYNSRSVSCGDFLKYEVGGFQRYVVSRKIKSVYDGLVPSQRKVLCYMIRKNNKKPCKVSNLAASVIEPMNYHHGPTSLEDTIIRMAQKFTGASVLPLLLPIGQFGTRDRGRKSKYAGASRYISTILNIKLVSKLFPKEDFELLPRVKEEGKIWEPLFLIPIIPYAVIDSLSAPACGWSSNNWARDQELVFKYIYMKLNDIDIPNHCSFLGKVHITNKMSIKLDEQKEICYGKYEVTGTKVHVTELPLGVWCKNYVKTLNDKDEVLKVIDKSTKDDVNIIVTLFSIPQKEELEKLLRIYKIQNPLLNMLYIDNEVLTSKSVNSGSYYVKRFDNYRDAIDEWYDKRTYYYKIRLERRVLLIKFNIIKQINILKFLNNDFINVSKKDMNEKYSEYVKIDHSILTHNNNELDKYITLMNENKSFGSYDYLMSLTHLKRTEEGKLKISNNIEKLKKNLEEAIKSNYKDIWRSELKELHDVISLGIKTDWKYGKTTRFG